MNRGASAGQIREQIPTARHRIEACHGRVSRELVLDFRWILSIWANNKQARTTDENARSRQKARKRGADKRRRHADEIARRRAASPPTPRQTDGGRVTAATTKAGEEQRRPKRPSRERGLADEQGGSSSKRRDKPRRARERQTRRTRKPMRAVGFFLFCVLSSSLPPRPASSLSRARRSFFLGQSRPVPSFCYYPPGQAATAAAASNDSTQPTHPPEVLCMLLKCC